MKLINNVLLGRNFKSAENRVVDTTARALSRSKISRAHIILSS